LTGAAPRLLPASGVIMNMMFWQTSISSLQYIVTTKFLVSDGIIKDLSNMSRDIIGFSAVGFALCTLVTGPAGAILTSFGTTGKIMSGGRGQYKRIAYLIFLVGICGSCCLLAPLFWWLSKKVTIDRERRSQKAKALWQMAKPERVLEMARQEAKRQLKKTHTRQMVL